MDELKEIKKGDDYMNASFSISPEKYFDTRFDYQEKLFTEKFNGQKAQFDERFNSLEAKIDAVDKRSKWSANLTFGILGLLTAMVGILLAMTALHH